MSRFYEDFDEEEFDEDVEYYAERPNKTQIKKDIAVLIKLGEALAGLPPAKRDIFEMPENIRTAIDQVAHMGQTGARKRSLKYIAQQFHKMDTSAIQEKLATLQNKTAHAVREHHITEKWRDRLIQEGHDVLTELVDEYPEVDSQHLRQLLRQIKKETSLNKPPKSSRVLYRYLKSIISPEQEVDEEADGDDED